ncbi:MAG: cytochrome P450 [Hyphomicrobiales bacterium]|nr:cytochrome P450 [Hyphomicrobiales bacterium]
MKPDCFVRIASVSELVGRGPFALSAEAVDLVVLRADQGWRAFEGRCPHQGALLGEGELEGDALVCRNHRWRFSVASGRRLGGEECLASCQVVERGGGLYADVSSLGGGARRLRETRSIDDLPGPPPLPVLGNLLRIDPARVHLVLEGWAAQYGTIYQFRLGPRRIVAVSDPALIEEAHRARPDAFRRQANMDLILSELGIRGVFNAEGDAWRAQRRLTVGALAQRNLRELYGGIRTVAERLAARWRRLALAGEPLDIVSELKRFTVDVAMRIAFGHDANTLEGSNDFVQRNLEILFPTINRRLFALAPTWRYFSLPADRRVERALGEIRAWLRDLLEQARERLAGEPMRAERPANFLEAMLTTADEEGKPFSDDTVMSNLLTFLAAGEDTTAYTLAWAVHQLCESPRWSSEISHEADAIAGPGAIPADYDQAGRLIRAGAVANETMRLRPVGPIGLLDANVDTVLGEYAIPKGASLAFLFRPATLDARNFADPLAFRPERWLEGIDGPQNVAAQMPFGAGPRMCPGRSLALIEIKTVLAALYGNFDVERVGDAAEVRELFGFTMSPAGLKVRLRTRGTGAPPSAVFAGA